VRVLLGRVWTRFRTRFRGHITYLASVKAVGNPDSIDRGDSPVAATVKPRQRAGHRGCLVRKRRAEEWTRVLTEVLAKALTNQSANQSARESARVLRRAFGRALGYVLGCESSKEAAEASTSESVKESAKVLERALAIAFGNEFANQSANELRKVWIRALSSE